MTETTKLLYWKYIFFFKYSNTFYADYESGSLPDNTLECIYHYTVYIMIVIC